jgi:hypothetical protein
MLLCHEYSFFKRLSALSKLHYLLRWTILPSGNISKLRKQQQAKPLIRGRKSETENDQEPARVDIRKTRMRKSQNQPPPQINATRTRVVATADQTFLKDSEESGIGVGMTVSWNLANFPEFVATTVSCWRQPKPVLHGLVMICMLTCK